ncbi:hypothetical protein BU692_09310 [Staphylococcus chromogenes]|uniref:DUF4064 domain-containing protein n=1 Tax=Staphylococcus chromogenes TaxID=46126 RepID=UPI000D19FD95|nr:hypothetical protein BU692_09310 [Staphylococcus chromogenes]
MKRTVEHVLTWIGVGLQTIGMLIIAFFALFFGASGDDFKESLVSDGAYTLQEANDVTTLFTFMITFGVIGGILLLILAVVGGIFINKNAKLAGILLLIAGVLSLLVSISGVLWLIAGIMLLVRKPVQNRQNAPYKNTATQPSPEGYEHVENHNPQRPKVDQHFENAEAEQRSKDIQKDPYKY